MVAEKALEWEGGKLQSSRRWTELNMDGVKSGLAVIVSREARRSGTLFTAAPGVSLFSGPERG